MCRHRNLAPDAVNLFAAILVAAVLGTALPRPALGQENPTPMEQADLQPVSEEAGPREPTASDGGIDNLGLIAMCSIVMAGLTITLGSIAPALGEGRAVAQALGSIAQQPDASNTITRTLFVGLAMVESTAIYCFVVSMILLFANPFWNYFVR